MEIQFTGPGLAFRATIEKVDRDKIYGFVKTMVFDDAGRECRYASLLDDGKTLIQSGGFALKLLDSEMNEVARKDLVAVDPEGRPMALVPSIFDREIPLRADVTIEDYLSLQVKAVYQISVAEGSEALTAALAGEKLLAFDFNYRASVEVDAAFLIHADNNVFAVVGTPLPFEFVSLDAPAPVEAAEEEAEDDFDFSML